MGPSFRTLSDRASLFQLLAKSGSVQKVASDTGLSISTVSHHLKNLEDNIGVGLIDHSRRPMILTPSGSILGYCQGFNCFRKRASRAGYTEIMFRYTRRFLARIDVGPTSARSATVAGKKTNNG